MSNRTFTIGGIHVPENKTASATIEFQPLPMTAILPLSQHIGAPARPVVAKGDKVLRGRLIAENSAFISAGIHAPISGTVTAVDQVVMANGKPAPAIIIKADEAEHDADTNARRRYWEAIVPGITDRTVSERMSTDDIRNLISQAGIVGLGGATFPSHVKLSPKPDQHPDILILNGCECEPYLMCDDALMRTYPARIVEGVELMMKASGIRRAVIAMEDNKPEAAAAIKANLDPQYDITVATLKTKYPQGGEKQLIEALTGRRVASGALPVSAGAIVHNVATAFAVWQAVATSMPLIERVITITGDIPHEQRRNYMAAIGTPMSEFRFTLPQDARAIAGGPMMGRTVVNLDAPVLKGTSGLTLLQDHRRRQPEACIRCGACVDACPMGLEPYLLSTYGRLRMWDEAREAMVADCLECGACSYSCPSGRPLLDYIRVAKSRTKK